MNTKPVKSYDQFILELRESRKLDEGLSDIFKSALQKIGKFFKGVGSSLYNALLLQNEGKLSGMKIFPSTVDITVMKENGFEVVKPSVNESSSEDDFVALNEKAISLMHPDPNVPNGGMQELKEQIEDMLFAIKNWKPGDEEVPPLMIWGAPGIGKTAIINEVVKANWKDEKAEKRLIDFALSMKSPEDFIVPYVSGRDELGNPTTASKTEMIPAAGLPVYKTGDKDGDEWANMKVQDADGNISEGGILFLDEISNASERTQKVCFSLLNERKLGDLKIGSKWLVMAASNRAGDDDVAIMSFSSRLNNRVVQMNFCPTYKDWHEWANKAVMSDGEFVVTREILAFLTFNNEGSPDRPHGLWYYYDPEPGGGREGSKIYPSPRSWTNASKSIEYRRKRKGTITDKEMEEIMAKSVGNEAAAEFMGFLAMTRKINMNEIKLVYTDANKAPVLKDLNPAEKNAVISTIVSAKSNKSFPKNEQEQFFDWLIRFTKESSTNGGFAITAISMMQDIHPELKSDDYWNYELKGKFFDENPSLTKKK